MPQAKELSAGALHNRPASPDGADVLMFVAILHSAPEGVELRRSVVGGVHTLGAAWAIASTSSTAGRCAIRWRRPAEAWTLRSLTRLDLAPSMI